MKAISGYPMSMVALLRAQFRVIVAIMLRDIRTRFFGHGLGFLIAIAWPLLHVLILIGLFTSFGRGTPYGESMVVFFATGLVPFFAFSYMSRFTMFSLVTNRPLLVFPAIKVLDILLARALLEILGSFCSIILLLIIFWLLDIDFTPADTVEATFALGAAMLLGAGFGILNGIIAMAVPTWATGYALVIIVLYMISGILFVSDSLPETVRYYVSFNPALQAVEWMRSAYYPDYSSILDKRYAIWWGLGTIFIGLLIERLVRGRLLANG
ncbi:MAG TPA: ABC transporter permease [Vineibacter sp.]|nr:ABC transporter permease [Vineibacter sp.]